MAIVGGYFDLPPGRDLGTRNRRLIAERLNWPAGAVEACEAVESAYPAWNPSYHAADVVAGVERPAGYYAAPVGAVFRYTFVYGADIVALLTAIRSRSSSCSVCAAVVPVPPGEAAPIHKVAGGDWCLARGQRKFTVDLRSGVCPACGSWVDVPPGQYISPHQDGRGEWCRARCSQRSV